MGIILIDDSLLMRAQLRTLLEEAGYSILDAFESAEQAFRSLESGSAKEVDLVLLNPTELLARVRSALRLKREMDRRKTREAELLEMTRQLEASVSFLTQISILDGLTGVANRRHFDEIIEREWKRAARTGANLTAIMVDIDYFKSYNDHYGHLQGDDCLRRVAGSLKAGLKRPADLVARYGGEEFVLVLPDTRDEAATALAESLRAGVQELGITHAGSAAAGQVTISLGLAGAVPSRSGSPADLIASADAALYAAKAGGRNRVVRWSSVAMPAAVHA